MTSAGTARRLWALGEPYHAVTYFADEARSAAGEAGLSGFWATYFALRAAPLGPVGPAVVTAAFYNFAPSFVARRVPGVWSAVTPEQALRVRLAAVDAVVHRVLGEWASSAEAAEAAELARIAAEAVDLPGRPLAAANAAVAEPDEPHLALWQALTTLREYRGDGHNAALLGREVSGVGAHVLVAAAGRVDREWLQKARGWGDDAWAAAADELARRGWLDGSGPDDVGLSAEGLAMVTAIEADTDRLALGPWRTLGDTRCDRLAELLVPLRRAVVAAGLFPDRNPIGVPPEAD
ncbi:SCO6745 family protein [Geodermatophilus sp. SYSU D00698]